MTPIRNNLLAQISDSMNQISNGVHPVSRPDAVVSNFRTLVKGSLARRLMG